MISTAAANLVVAGYERHRPERLDRCDRACSGPGCWLIGILFGTAFALGALTPVNGDVSLWGFIGASMLLAAARGDGGCEVLAFPNALTGRRDRIGCILFTPIDAAE